LNVTPTNITPPSGVLPQPAPPPPPQKKSPGGPPPPPPPWRHPNLPIWKPPASRCDNGEPYTVSFPLLIASRLHVPRWNSPNRLGMPLTSPYSAPAAPRLSPDYPFGQGVSPDGIPSHLPSPSTHVVSKPTTTSDCPSTCWVGCVSALSLSRPSTVHDRHSTFA